MPTSVRYCSSGSKNSESKESKKQEDRKSNDKSFEKSNIKERPNSIVNERGSSSNSEFRNAESQNSGIFNNNESPGMNQEPGDYSSSEMGPGRESEFYQGMSFTQTPDSYSITYFNKTSDPYSGTGYDRTSEPYPGMASGRMPDSYQGMYSREQMSPYQNQEANLARFIPQFVSSCVSILSNLANMISSIMPGSSNNMPGASGNNTDSYSQGSFGGRSSKRQSAGLMTDNPSYGSGDRLSCNGSSSNNYGFGSRGGNLSGGGNYNIGKGSSSMGTSINGCNPNNGTGLTNTGTGAVNPKTGKSLMNTSVLPQSSQTQGMKSHFDQVLKQSTSLREVSEPDVNGMYNEYITCDSLVKMYRATGDPNYIKRACEISDVYINMGKDMDGDGYKDWKAKDIPQNMNHDHYEWRAADGVAELANQIMSDPKLKQQFGAQGQKYTQFIEKDVWQKWNNKVGRCGAINKVPSEQHFIARIGKIALNMYNYTGDKKYKGWLDQNVPKLQQAIAKTGDIGGTIKGGSMDSGHAADTADFVSECYKAGLYFNKNDMQRLAQSAKKRGLPPGFVKLAQFDQSLYQAYLNKMKSFKYRDGGNVTANLAAMTAEGLM